MAHVQTQRTQFLHRTMNLNYFYLRVPSPYMYGVLIENKLNLLFNITENTATGHKQQEKQNKEQQQLLAIEIPYYFLFNGVTQHCMIFRPQNSAYTRRFVYVSAIIQLSAKDENKCCCQRKINTEFCQPMASNGDISCRGTFLCRRSVISELQ